MFVRLRCLLEGRNVEVILKDDMHLTVNVKGPTGWFTLGHLHRVTGYLHPMVRKIQPGCGLEVKRVDGTYEMLKVEALECVEL